MNKVTRNIAAYLDNQNTKNGIDYSLSGLTKEQIDQINEFSKAFSRTSPIPFPLKIK